MATIPMGNFGQRIARPMAAPEIRGSDALAQASGRLIETANGVMTDMAQRETAERQKRMDERMSNDAMLTTLDFEVNAKTAAADIVRRVQTGEMERGSADKEWRSAFSALHGKSIDKLPVSRYRDGAVQRAMQVQAAGTMQLAGAVDAAERQQLGADAVALLDRFGKLSTLPGADLDNLFGLASPAFTTLARRAGIPEAQASKSLQSWQDSTRFRRAQLDLAAVRRDPEGLDQFISRLDSGNLVGVLDPEHQMALVREAEGYRWQLDRAQQHLADKREKQAERAIGRAQQQIDAGVPLTAEAWQTLRDVVQGTGVAADFNGLVASEREVQQVLRMPIDQQEQYLQQRDMSLMQKGGTLADRANLQRIRATVDGNRKELEAAPLVAAQRLFGREVAPVDFAKMLVPGGEFEVAPQFQDRAATLAAMQQQFGNRVGFKPLLPQEAAFLTRGLAKLTPTEAADVFGQLRKSIDDDEVYRAAMQQIAPDSPVKAHAGMLVAMGQGLTLARNWLSADERASSRRVAETMLAGEAVLNKSRADKAADGKPHSLFVPGHAVFTNAFADVVGDLYRGRPMAQEADLQAVMAYYVGKASETGRISRDGQDVDNRLLKESITATLGNVVNVNGQGSARAPLGMEAGDFQGKLREQFAEAVRARGLPASMLNEFEHYGFINYRQDGQYALTLGGVPVIDPKTRVPLVIDLAPPSLSSSRYRRMSDRIPSGPALPASAGGAQ